MTQIKVRPSRSAADTRVRPAFSVYPVFMPMQPSYRHSSLLWLRRLRPATVTVFVETVLAKMGFSMAQAASTARSRAVE